MKKTMILAAAAAMFMFSSCQKEEVAPDQNSLADELVFTATIDQSSTKTTVNTDASSASRGKVSWVANDEISVSDGDNTAVYYIKNASDIAADGSATFTFKSGSTLSTEAASYTATYGTAITTAQTYSSTVNKLPMSGVSDSNNKTTLNFAVTCGLLKLSLTASSSETDKTISKIEITGTPSGGSKSTYTLSCSSNVAISSAANFYIALPAGSYNSMVFYNKSGYACQKTNSSGMAIAANKIQPVTLTGIAFKLLPGKFTVNSAGKQVRFSNGNLQATVNASGIPTAWKFATHQYDFIGNATANTTIGSKAGTVDLFGWSTSTTSYGISTSTEDSYSGDFKDWGVTIDSKGTWRTMSREEWAYLISTRTVNGGTGNGKSYLCATVNSVYGMILFPDNYTSQSSATSYNLTAWSAMESAGCVFLPAAGSRRGSSVSDIVEMRGYYWSSTLDMKDKAYDMYFVGGAIYADNFDYRFYGNSVRLVTDIQ